MEAKRLAYVRVGWSHWAGHWLWDSDQIWQVGEKVRIGSYRALTRLTMENTACFSTIGLVEASEEGSGESLAAGQVGWSACSAFEKVTRLVKDFIEGRI